MIALCFLSHASIRSHIFPEFDQRFHPLMSYRKSQLTSLESSACLASRLTMSSHGLTFPTAGRSLRCVFSHAIEFEPPSYHLQAGGYPQLWGIQYNELTIVSHDMHVLVPMLNLNVPFLVTFPPSRIYVILSQYYNLSPLKGSA